MLMWGSLFEKIRFLFFSETDKSWDRTNIIRLFIPHCGSTKSKGVVKVKSKKSEERIFANFVKEGEQLEQKEPKSQLLDFATGTWNLQY